MEQFVWAPVSCEPAAAPRAREVKFGDGYSQRSRDGINTRLRQYSLSFADRPAVIGQIDEFLARHGAVDAFLFEPAPGADLVTVICRQWSGPQRGGWQQLNCTFEEVPA